jgi:hypothetical protein
MATHALQQQRDSLSRRHTLLTATTDSDQRAFLVAQLDADGHTVYEADSTLAAVAKLSADAINVLILRACGRVPYARNSCGAASTWPATRSRTVWSARGTEEASRTSTCMLAPSPRSAVDAI